MTRKHMPALILSVLLILSLAAPAGAETGAKPVLAVGEIAGVEELMETLFPGKYEVVVYPTTNETLAALKSGRVDASIATEDYADFIMKGDDTLRFIPNDIPPASLSMLTREADTDLTAKLNDAIEALKENGTLDALYAQYVTAASPDDVPQAPVIESVQGAETVTVGISGDVPPHDYVSVDGKPSGYNVALMGEIARLAGFTVEFETIAFGTKFAALLSGRIDLFFLHAGYTSFEGIVATSAYDEDVRLGVLMLK